MPFDTFVPPVGPVVDGAPRKKQIRTKQAKFGDAYVQEVPDGMNYVETKVSITFPLLTVAQAQQIEDFILGHPAVPFLYQVPGEPVALQWKCKTWSRMLAGNAIETMTMDLEQDFSIGAAAAPGLDFSQPGNGQFIPTIPGL
jgi:phage-related protein